MSHRLNKYVTSNYVSAMQRLRGHSKRRKVVAYVESYDDIFFWRSLLSELETEQMYFEVMLPSRTTLQKGKKTALLEGLAKGLGRDMIVCVSAPNAGWVRYLPDTLLTLSTEQTTYTYEFEMKKKDDENGRLEFNMGNKGSTATIYIKNVRLEEIE